MSIIDDAAYQDSLVALMVQDRHFLRRHGHLLTASDFKPQNGSAAGRDRWIVATKALEHYGRYHEPIANLLGAALKDHIKLARLASSRSKQLLSYGLRATTGKTQVQPVTDRLMEWKRTVVRADAISRIIDLNDSGSLSSDEWLEILREVMSVEEGIAREAVDHYAHLEDRIARRSLPWSSRFPALMIDPFDQLSRAIGRGHLGLVMGPFKRGKSQMLIWIAKSYTIQRLNVLFFTLEDPLIDVEDRFDASISELPIKQLGDNPDLLRARFKRFVRLAKGRLKIWDGTDEQITVGKIEQIWQRYRDQGWTADAVIVDYDQYIRPAHSHRERRHEFQSIYADLRAFAARHDLLIWTGAQTRRKTERLKILSGDELSEDIGKPQNVAFCIGLGQGDWGEQSIYLHIAAHKHDAQHIGCNIMTDRECMIIFDRDRTLDMMRKDALAAEEEEGEETP